MTSTTKLSRRRLLREASVAVGATAVAAATVESTTAATADTTAAALRRAHPAGAQDVRQVSFMSPGSLTDQQIFQDAIAEAQEESLNDLGIQINWNAAPSGDWERIMTMFAADQAYDIQRIDDDRVYLLALENKIHQLDPWMLDPEIGMDQAAYYPRFFSSLAIEGYQFGMIPASSANVVYYNRDHFEQAGIEAPTTWADAWSL
jgi:multiple sugar transport system substrate-binding protein